MLSPKFIERFIEGRIKKDMTIALGTHPTSYKVIRELALKNVLNDLNVKIAPTSLDVAQMANDYKIHVASFNNEIDLFIDFASSYDSMLNYTKTRTESLIRDKILQYYAKECVVFAELGTFEQVLKRIPVEISRFSHERVVSSLDTFGKATLRMDSKGIFRTLGQNYIVDLDLDSNYTYEDISFKLRTIPGVLEIGVFESASGSLYTVSKSSIKKV